MNKNRNWVYWAVMVFAIMGFVMFVITRPVSRKHIPVITKAYYVPGDIVVDAHDDLIYNGVMNGKVILSKLTYYRGGKSIPRYLSVGSSTKFYDASVLILAVKGDGVLLRVVR